jgi:paraquat-inducible protein B
MSQHANAVKVGSFVIAGVLLTLVAILILGAGQLFSHRAPFVLYFADSVHGLTVGSAVKFKGVPIGTVSRIQVALREGDGPQYIPVFIEVEEDLILSATGERVSIRDGVFVTDQIGKGLRASLELESFITGRLYVQLDYYASPGPPQWVQKSGTLPEIPTVSTGLSEFLKSLERVDLPGMSARIGAVLDDLQRLLAEAQLGEVSRQLVRSLDAVENLTRGPELKEALHSFARGMEEARQLLAELRVEVPSVTSSFNTSAQQAAQTLAEVQRTAAELRRLLGPDSRMLGDLQGALESIAEAARAIQTFADYLNRNPRALITGRPPIKAKP